VENRSLAIGLTVAAIIACGLPGLMSICVSALIVIDGPFPDQPEVEWILGFSLFCIGLTLVAIPIVVGIRSLRRKREDLFKSSPNEPIPPQN
jgi:hypothetical protein